MRRVIAIILLSLSILSIGQEKERPKIGLVLSGGGAKGLAHVGILQALDSAGLSIDYITGTSMGAIIAAMYASGYSGNEINKIARDMDWMNAIMGSTAEYNDFTIDAKDEYGNYIIEIPMDDGFKIKWSTGVLEPKEVMLKLEEVFFPVYKIKDFSKLSIPFKCITTDLSTGHEIVLDKGDLAFATRSSMAIPGVFSATKYKGTKLVDGGIVRNFPVKDVKAMGADYVIGVNLFSGLSDPNELTSMMDVMMQIINFQDANDLIYEKSICDMVIEPDVSKYSAASFSSSDEIYKVGEEIGKEFYPLFKQLADSLHKEYGMEYAKKDRLPSHYETVEIDSVWVDGLKNTTQSLLMHNLNLHLNHSYTVSEIHDAIRKAYNSQYYSKIRYELYPIDDKNGVCLKLYIEEIPMNFINVALSYNTYTGASLILGYTGKDLIGERSLTRFKVGISEAFRVHLSHRQYYGDNYFKYVQAQYNFSTFDVPVYSGSTKEALYSYSHNEVSLSAGRLTKKNSDLRVKMGYETFNLRPDVSGDTVKYDGRVSNAFVNLSRRINTLDRKYLPQRGICTDVNIYAAFRPQYNFDNLRLLNKVRDNVYRITMNGMFYQPVIHNRASVFEQVALTATYGDKTMVHNTFVGGIHEFLPSHFTFIGLHTAQRHESTMAMGKLGFQYRVVGDLYAMARFNVGMSFSSLDKYFVDKEKFAVNDWFYGFGLTAAYNLSFLPFDVTLMYSPDAKFIVGVNVGFYF